MHYRSEVDGLRALAIVPVILFHAGVQWFSGGFVGVDVFFVISGYLITSIILNEAATGRFSILNFYERRARRILPALLAVTACCLPFAWALLMPADMKSFSRSLIAVALFASNVLFWRTSSYFESASELNPLLHTWSLAVEEQYYVVFPVVILLVLRTRKRLAKHLLMALALGSLVAAQWNSSHAPEAGFYLLPSRGWELLIGSLVALHLFENIGKKPGMWISEAGGLVGILLIAYAVFAFSDDTPFPSVYTLVPTVGTAFIILFASPQTLAGKLLGSRLLVGIGMISYSLYLWHQPILAFSRHWSTTLPSAGFTAALLAITTTLAYLSWRYVEAPFRSRQRFNRRQIFAFSAVGNVACILLGAAALTTNGFENRLSADQKALLNYSNYNYSPVYKEGTCLLLPDQKYTSFSKDCESTGGKQPVLVWGDSYAAALSFGLRHEMPELTQLTASGCPPMLDIHFATRPHCKDINDFIVSKLDQLRPKTVILHANWLLYMPKNPPEKIQPAIDLLKRTMPETRIIVIGPVPQWLPTLPVVMVKNDAALRDGIRLHNVLLSKLRPLDAALADIAARNGLEFISPLELMCVESRCETTTTYQDKVSLTAWDIGHLTAAGSSLLVSRMVQKHLLQPQQGFSKLVGHAEPRREN